MRSFWKRLAGLLVGTAISPAICLASVIIQYNQLVFPPGLDQTLKFRLCQTWIMSGILLVNPSLVIWNEEFDGVPVRIYSPKTVSTAKRKAVLYFHGGSGIMGSYGKRPLPSQPSIAKFLRYLAKEGNAMVVTVGYGLAPESPYPSQHVECLKVATFLIKHADDYGVDSSRIILSGDSFGGTLATHVCQVLTDRSDLPKIHAQALIYPALQGLDLSLPSYQQNRRSPLLWPKLVAFLGCRYLDKPTSLADGLLKGSHVPKATRQKYQKWVSADHIPERFKARGYVAPEPSSFQFDPRLHEEMKVVLTDNFSPLLAEDTVIAKLPQTFLLTCEFDVLRDDGLLYLRRLMDNRVPVTWSHVENGVHGISVCYGYCFLSFSSANRIDVGQSWLHTK
uniref:Alpha/beta hydrolase fold-3 domain-containing protein n=1 Tax=Pseudonaja textilis TaxID=8673 RepID=A0A670ZLI4_PSETE